MSELVEVTRCWQCKHSTPVKYGLTNLQMYICEFCHDRLVDEDHYCSWGEEEEDADIS